MKTLKNFFTCLDALIKKIFFNEKNASFTPDCNSNPHEIKKLTNDIERMKLEEYISKYKATTRWQTL